MNGKYEKKIRIYIGYFLALGFISFMGTPQQIKSHEEQPHASSTTTISPHSSHLYFAPFFATHTTSTDH
jgi:hypothetical protein